MFLTSLLNFNYHFVVFIMSHKHSNPGKGRKMRLNLSLCTDIPRNGVIDLDSDKGKNSAPPTPLSSVPSYKLNSIASVDGDRRSRSRSVEIRPRDFVYRGGEGPSRRGRAEGRAERGVFRGGEISSRPFRRSMSVETSLSPKTKHFQYICDELVLLKEKHQSLRDEFSFVDAEMLRAQNRAKSFEAELKEVYRWQSNVQARMDQAKSISFHEGFRRGVEVYRERMQVLLPYMDHSLLPSYADLNP